MVAGAPKEGEAVRKFFEFCGEGSVLVAHNASFDTEVIRSACERNGIEYNYSHIDTLVLAQSLISGIKNYKLDTISNHFKLPKFDHHRADEDAGALAAIFEKLLALTAEKGVERVSQINELIPVDPRRLPTYHIIILAKNKVGLKHLYQLITNQILSIITAIRECRRVSCFLTERVCSSAAPAKRVSSTARCFRANPRRSCCG